MVTCYNVVGTNPAKGDSSVTNLPPSGSKFYLTMIDINLATALDNHRHLNKLRMRLCIGSNENLRGKKYEQKGFDD